MIFDVQNKFVQSWCEFDFNSLSPHFQKPPVAPARHLSRPPQSVWGAHSPECIKIKRNAKTLPSNIIFIFDWLLLPPHWSPISNCVLDQVCQISTDVITVVSLINEDPHLLLWQLMLKNIPRLLFLKILHHTHVYRFKKNSFYTSKVSHYSNLHVYLQSKNHRETSL